MSWLWPIAFGLGVVLFLTLMKILVRIALMRIFGTVEAYQAFVRDRARKIFRRSF